MTPILAFFILVAVVLSFIRTPAKRYAFFIVNALMIIALTLLPRHHSSGGTMANLGDGLGDLMQLIILSALYAIYLLAQLIAWLISKKKKTTV